MAAMSSGAIFEVRQASAADVEAIADAHRDSIDSLGAAYYPADVTRSWHAAVTPDLYLRAMEGGEVFFIALGALDGRQQVLGFSSDYVIEGSTHGVSAYVRGRAARRGIATALLNRAEAHAVEHGGARIEIESALSAVEFYKANGFIELGRGEVDLPTGRRIACVFMRKELLRD